MCYNHGPLVSPRFVREVMVPRTDMVTVSDDSTVEQVIELSIQHGFSRIPVCREGIDDIVGVLHIKDLVQSGPFIFFRYLRRKLARGRQGSV